MDIQIQQLLTHLFGFLVVLYILRKFAWGPLLAMLEERRKRIADEFAGIDLEKARVAELTGQYEGKLRDIDVERRAKLVEAVDEGKKIAREIKASAQEETRQARERAKDELERDVAKAKVELKGDMIAMTLTAAEKIIHEKLDNEKHRRLIGEFIDNMEKA